MASSLPLIVSLRDDNFAPWLSNL